MKNPQIINKDTQYERTVYELENGDDLSNFKLLGKGTGQNIGMCWHEAMLHVPDFLRRLAAYKIEVGDQFGKMLGEAYEQAGLKQAVFYTVSFYELKKGHTP